MTASRDTVSVRRIVIEENSCSRYFVLDVYLFLFYVYKYISLYIYIYIISTIDYSCIVEFTFSFLQIIYLYV